jgi:hypothetical protein
MQIRSFDPNDPTALWPGDIVDGFEVVRLVGEGATSRVYEVRSGDTRRALKLFTVHGPGARAQLRLEAQLLGRLDHPNVVRTWGLTESEGRLGLLLELVDGATLADLLGRGPVPPDRALQLARALVSGVSAAHAAGLVHQDLKPSNVLVDVEGNPASLRIADFGMARRGPTSGSTWSGARGTARYLAPEALDEDRPLDKRADVFALGIILYELFCGRHPFPAERLKMFNAAANGDYPPPRSLAPSLSESVETAIRHALSPDPDLRIPDAIVLSQWMEGDQSTWKPPIHDGPTLVTRRPAGVADLPATPPTSPIRAPEASVAPAWTGGEPWQERTAVRGWAAALAGAAMVLVIAAVTVVAVQWSWRVPEPQAEGRMAVEAAGPIPGEELPNPAPAPAAPITVEAAPAAPEPAPAELAPPDPPSPAPVRPAPRPSPRPRPTAAAPVPAVTPPPAPAAPEPAPASAPAALKLNDLKSPWKR